MKYQVLLRGENFELNWEGKIKNLGFFTTRWVKANSVEDAEKKAVQLIQNDKWLQSALIEKSEYSPMVYMEEISQAKWWKRVGGKGYTFWEMGNE